MTLEIVADAFAYLEQQNIKVEYFYCHPQDWLDLLNDPKLGSLYAGVGSLTATHTTLWGALIKLNLTPGRAAVSGTDAQGKLVTHNFSLHTSQDPKVLLGF